MNEKILKKLREYTTIGNKVRYYDKNNPHKIYFGEVIDEVSEMSSDDPEYKHFIQKIKWKDGSELYRICYYVISKNGKSIVFGQFASTQPKNTIKELLNKAIKKFRL